jgi:4-oxalocrotonate tautomerase
MSIITVRLIEGLLSTAQRQQLARTLTNAVVRIEGEAMRAVTWCVIEEVKNGNWTIGGQPLTRSDSRVISGGENSNRVSPACVSKLPAAGRTRA